MMWLLISWPIWRGWITRLACLRLSVTISITTQQPPKALSSRAISPRRKPRRYLVRPPYPPAIPALTVSCAADGPTLRDIWAESARWDALINSGQLAIADWLPVRYQARVVNTRRGKVFVT